MSNIQTMLTIGAMLLLALVSLNFNSTVLNTSTSDMESKIYLTAFSISDNLIEEIKQKSFDQSTIDFPTTNTASLTPPASLGPEAGETYPNYNDVDDYNGFKDTVTAPYFETYYVSCSVEYVDSNDPDAASSTQTFYKKVTVTVNSPFLRHSVSLSSIFTLK